MNMPTPFATAAPAAASNHPFAQAEAQVAAAPAAASNHPFAQAEAQVAAPAAATGDVVAKAPRKSSRRLTMEEQTYVLSNYKDKNPATIAQELTLQASQAGLTAKAGGALPIVTSAQVANTVRSARKKVQDKIDAAQEAGQTNVVAALTAKLEEALPKRSFRGTGGGNTGPRTSTLDSIVDTLFQV